MVKGAALFLQQGGSAQGPKTPTHHKLAGRNKHAQIKLSFLNSQAYFLPLEMKTNNECTIEEAE
uniref:Uncharacterized protein n=1 Tax=Sander lucioperca TaxID=283035 RepID=A0A8C9YN92_SANLU